MASVVRSINGFDSNPGEIKTIFSAGTKTVLKRLLNDAITLIDSEELCDSGGLGVLASHLEEIANHVDPSDQFSCGFSGDLTDPKLNEQLHRSYGNTWQEILSDCKSLWSAQWFTTEANEAADDEEAGDDEDDDIESAEAPAMLWDVWVVDLEIGTSYLTVSGLSLASVEDAKSRWSDPSSVLIAIPSGCLLVGNPLISDAVLGEDRSSDKAGLDHRQSIAENAEAQTCDLSIFVDDHLRLSTSELNPDVTKLLLSHIESILTETPIGFGTPEELGVMASGLLDIAYGDSEGSEADAIHEQFLSGLWNGGAINTTVQSKPTGRCYSNTAKAGLVSILSAGIKGIQAGHIGAAGDFGLLAMRIAGACEQFDRLPEPGDGKARIIDAMVNEWHNEQLDAFLDSQLNATAN